MLIFRRQFLATLAVSLLATPMLSGSAGAQPCVEIADGDVVIADISADAELIKITDVSVAANTALNQEIVCGGTLPFPRSLDFDREGRIWTSVTDGLIRTDPFDLSFVEQLRVFQFQGLFASPEGILKQLDGPVFVAQPPITTLSQIVRFDEVNGIPRGFTALGASGVPLGLIFDPAGNDPEDMLMVDSGSGFQQVAAGLYSVNQAGGINGIARNGYIATPFRGASLSPQYVYVSDIGGNADRDGEGMMFPPGTRPAQIIRIDRNIAFDFEDDEADGRVNQALITDSTVTGSNLVTPVGIEVLEEDGFYPDTLLVADAFALGGALIRIDFDPAGIIAPIETVVAVDVNFVTPYEVKIVRGIDPQPRRRLFVTDTGAAPASTGIVYIDPGGTSGMYTSGMIEPTAIVVDPAAVDDFYVSDVGVPEIVRVIPATPDTGTFSTVSSGGMLVEPTALVVESDGAIVVADRGAGKVLRIDPTSGVQTVIAEAGMDSFIMRPAAVGIDIEGYLQVTDEGDETITNDARLLRINPQTGKQFCVAEDRVARLDTLALELDDVRDLVFDREASSVYSINSVDPPDPNAFQSPLIRFDTTAGFFDETFSAEFVNPRGIAIAENRDIITVDAGDPAMTTDKRLLRTDPILPSNTNEPEIVNGSTTLADPFGVAVDQIARPTDPPVDSDGDGVFDPEDNCIDTPNPNQVFPDLGDELATEANRFGSVCFGTCPPGGCTCDVDGNGSVGLSDFLILNAEFGNDCDAFPEFECSADCFLPADSIVGLPDFLALLDQFGEQTPGTFGALVKSPFGDACP